MFPSDGPLSLIISALAVFRLAVFIGEDAFPPIAWLREKILARWPSEDTRFTVTEVDQDIEDKAWYIAGTGREVIQVEAGQWIALTPSKWSKVITCVWCSSMWIAGGAFALDYHYPQVWVPASVILALSAVAGLIQGWRE